MPAPHKRKRKATDDDDDDDDVDVERTVVEAPQKISKKQRRDDARARAIAWAENDKKNNPGDDCLKTPTKRRKIAISSTVSSTFKNQTTTKATTTTATTTATATERQGDATTSKSKLSKKERLEQAKTRARQWANETQSPTKEKTLTKMTAVATVKGTPPKQASHKSLPVPFQADVYNEDEMQDAVEEAIFQEVIGTKLKQKSNLKPIIDPVGCTITVNPIAASVHAAERNMVQIQMELEKQIQYQVLENVLKTINPQLQAQQQLQMNPHQHQRAQSPIQPTTYSDCIRTTHEQNIPHKNNVNRKRPFLTMSLSVIVVVSAIAVGVHFTPPNQTSDTVLPASFSLPPCFMSNQMDMLEGIPPPNVNEQSITKCDISSIILG